MRFISMITLFALSLLTGCAADNGLTTADEMTSPAVFSSHKMKLDDLQVGFGFGYVTDVFRYAPRINHVSFNQIYIISVDDMIVEGKMKGSSNVIKIELSRRSSTPVESLQVDFPHPNGLVDGEVVLCSVEYLENYKPVTQTFTRRLFGIDGVFIMEKKGDKREFYLDATFVNTHSIADATDLLDITGTWRDTPLSVVLE